MKRLFTSSRYTPLALARTLLLLLCMQAFLGCERRPLEEALGSIASVPFTFDWSKSGLDQSKMQRASIWFFPHNGDPSFEWRVQGNLTEATVPLALGKYSIIVFNETTDESDWQRIAFEGQDKYNTFHVYAAKDDFKGLYTRADEADIRKTPEALASWSLDEFEVTTDMIAYTRGTRAAARNEGAVSKSLKSVSNITPQPLTVAVKVTAYVQNLKSAVRCSAALNGATGRVSLATRRPVLSGVTHIFVMNNRKYDSPESRHGTIEANLLLFTLVEEKEAKYELQLDFELHNSTIAPSELFDISDQIDKEKTTIEVNIGFNNESDPEKDHPIILPLVEVGSSVGVDDWDNIDIPIN